MAHSPTTPISAQVHLRHIQIARSVVFTSGNQQLQINMFPTFDHKKTVAMQEFDGLHSLIMQAMAYVSIWISHAKYLQIHLEQIS